MTNRANRASGTARRRGWKHAAAPLSSIASNTKSIGLSELFADRQLACQKSRARVQNRIFHAGAKDIHVIGEVSNGRDAVAMVQRMNPDVLVMDVTMPVLDGIEAAKKLKELGCESKIVFLTVHSDPDFLRACLAAGGLGYVTKSRMSSDLSLAVEHALAERIFISPTVTGQQ